MINHYAIQLLDHYLETNMDLFVKEATAFKTNVAVYCFLKNEFKKGDIRNNVLFQWVFSSFYRMGMVSIENRKSFFARMESLRDKHSSLDAKHVTEELRTSLGKELFSFATKMINLLDDESYPIYDKHVAIVFQKPFRPDETALGHKASVYEDIIDTYKELRSHSIISDFKTTFHCPEMGYMKVLDALFWHLGHVLDGGGLERTPGEFLSEQGQ